MTTKRQTQWSEKLQRKQTKLTRRQLRVQRMQAILAEANVTKKPPKHKTLEQRRQCKELIEWCAAPGRAAQLARDVGVKPSHVSLWLNGKRAIPVKHCFAISRATDGYVPPEKQRPDFDWARFREEAKKNARLSSGDP